MEDYDEKRIRRTNSLVNVATGFATLTSASTDLLGVVAECKRINADVKIAHEQANLITHKMDLDFAKEMAVLNRSMDSRDKVLALEGEALQDAIQKGNTQQIIAAMAAMNCTLDKSPVDELNKLKQSTLQKDQLLDW